MRRHDPSQSRQLLTLATMAAISAAVVFSVTHPVASLSAPDSLSDTAYTVSHETLAVEEPVGIVKRVYRAGLPTRDGRATPRPKACPGGSRGARV